MKENETFTTICLLCETQDIDQLMFLYKMFFFFFNELNFVCWRVP